ncbi:replication restart helicase PriA [Xanthocytophaga flava]|uniref:replication restart helicase PriA n=1 Tax=Xanthocytophaga flava TaxID=3048013 RepID=UPI0028D87AC4|nr:primosomal protein N' [Xanthocytophaga flavus]MDJ1466443.1 primosomal protein N' [Xanthocytophaga flavus]
MSSSDNEINESASLSLGLFPEVVTLFVDVIVPLPLPNLLTYRVPAIMNDMIQVGARVIVQLGTRRILTAIVARVHQDPPKKYIAKPLLELLDEAPMVTTYQLELFRWVADYYMCHIGEVMNAALPSGLKINSESKLQYNPEFDINTPLTETEGKLLEAVQEKNSLSTDEAARLLGQKDIYPIIKSLSKKGAVLVYEEVKEKYTPKIVKKIRLTRDYEDWEPLKDLIDELEDRKQYKQVGVLMKYLARVPVMQNRTANADGLEKSVLVKDDISESALKTLLKKNVFEEFEIIISRFADVPYSGDDVQLSDSQQLATEKIMSYFKTKDTVLLHGITGSGKTAVYINLIQKVLASGSQVLYLLPEIALTTQIVSRLRKVFGDQMGIYHSKFSDNERVEVWRGVLSGKFNFVIGVRSAIFLPFDNLGLIVVDEEHESSYKQYDPAPRYNARDLALVVARLQQAKVLMGSATPSFESFYNAKQGRYGYVKLTQRFREAQLPEISLVNIRIERKQKKLKHNFSDTLLTSLKDNLTKGEQSILFQNRRGYAPYVMCEDCGWIPHCHQCNVSLTYHQHTQEMRCHYCGFTEQMSHQCPVCGSTRIKTMGYGTEKIEDELKLLIPQARTARMDLDTTRQKNAIQNIVQAFEAGETDILIGTQMLSKGLDFDKVSFVGIFDADHIIHFPDFRAHERAFQLLTQVAGRAGRRNTQGRVLIQTGNPELFVIEKILQNDYEGLYEKEIPERQKFNYPPFTRLIRLIIKHEDEIMAEEAAQALANGLREKMGSRVLGPEPPLVNRIRNQFLKDILIKLEKDNINLRLIKEQIREEIQKILTTKQFKQASIVIDVDPM